MAAADGDDRGYHLKSILFSLFPDLLVRHHLLIDSKFLFETITTLHQSGDYRLRKIVSRMRESFESGEPNVVRWIPGLANYANALTKRNLEMSPRLNNRTICYPLETGILITKKLAHLIATRGNKSCAFLDSYAIWGVCWIRV